MSNSRIFWNFVRRPRPTSLDCRCRLRRFSGRGAGKAEPQEAFQTDAMCGCSLWVERVLDIDPCAGGSLAGKLCEKGKRKGGSSSSRDAGNLGYAASRDSAPEQSIEFFDPGGIELRRLPGLERKRSRDPVRKGRLQLSTEKSC